MPKRLLSPIEVAAEKTVSGKARQHSAYARESFTERDLMGQEMDGSRMRRIAPVKGLEKLLKKTERRKEDLPDYIRYAAFEYHGMLEMAAPQADHEIKDFIDRCANPGEAQTKLIEAMDKLERLHRRMGKDTRNVLAAVFINHPDKSLSEIWPKQYTRRLYTDALKDALYWLAGEFGYVKRIER